MPKPSYDTVLSPSEEIAFTFWANHNYPGKKIQDITNDYDLRGAWREIQKGSIQFDERKHLPDKYKKPNHITFSKESIYAGKENPGGKWHLGANEGKSGKQEKPIWHFEPSAETVKLHGAEKLQNYFQQNEPESRLILSKFTPQETIFYKQEK